jgi:hypothetical protein
MKILQFAALVLTAIALMPAGAHFFALPNKLHLAQVDYFIVQNIYRGWALFGIVLIANLIANSALAIALRGTRGPLVFVLINVLCQVATLAIFFVFTFPANSATANWTAIPPNWEALRWQWEISHAVNAVIAFAGFCALTISVLLTRK